ncbi:hypothetical protein Ddye_013042 [Dipteronia dyeriana]|uniref:Coatomer subunit zeta n=1 Tax=Dipteronia dyeriana TaxID=168575 RepID=A0AAE0CJ90_9ROSI|nr:hypothetical protein Ddye_013042 [Dipteronia dyeriana]
MCKCHLLPDQPMLISLPQFPAADIALLDNNIVIYKDLHFFVTGSIEENELLLCSVLLGFFDAVTRLLRNNVDKREALENLNLIFLYFNEIVDRGVIAGKVAVHNMDGDSPLAEQVCIGYSKRTFDKITSKMINNPFGQRVSDE